ncbi:MAG: DUF3597 family protein [Anaerolineales bacterium]|nr:DUF3597 family protein [Anaerolineales bacterium]
MGLFDSILEKLGIKKAPEAKPASKVVEGGASATAAAAMAASAAAAKKAIPVVDVVTKLEGMAKKYPMKLNWKESIVDLLVLLDLPHGAEDLKNLAVELNCPAAIVDDSFKRNMWLHKTVLKLIAENGGNIPQNLLD